jgi:hypothetical protein
MGCGASSAKPAEAKEAAKEEVQEALRCGAGLELLDENVAPGGSATDRLIGFFIA